jgi:hypothetical protein
MAPRRWSQAFVRGQAFPVKISAIKWVFCAAAAIYLTGCAQYRSSGNAPGAVSGTARSDSRAQGEFYNTETLSPGVGSALFPDPSWR